MSLMASRGVKCSPAVSLEASANRRMRVLEDRAHLGVGDRGGMHVGVGELLYDEVEPVVVLELPQGLLEAVPLEDVRDVRRELRHVVDEAVRELLRGPEQALERVRRAVPEVKVVVAPQLGGQRSLVGRRGDHRLDLVAMGVQHALHASQDRERQHHRPVLRRLVHTPQLIRDRPHEVAQLRHVLPHRCFPCRRGSRVCRSH
jgi:hypothetical protein